MNKTTSRKKKTFLWISAAVLGLILLAAIIFEINVQLKFNSVDREMARVSQSIAQIKGAVQDNGENTSYARRGGIIDRLTLACLSARCPAEQKTWRVTAPAGKEGEFVRDTVLRAGYTADPQYQKDFEKNPCTFAMHNVCAFQGRKDNYSLTITLEDEGPNSTSILRVGLGETQSFEP